MVSEPGYRPITGCPQYLGVGGVWSTPMDATEYRDHAIAAAAGQALVFAAAASASAIPRAASASARSFSGCPEWPLTHSHSTW